MRKHNRRFAQRWSRDSDDRSNMPQSMAHKITNDKGFQLSCSYLLVNLLRRAGVLQMNAQVTA